MLLPPLRGALGRPEDYFPGALAAHVAGPSSRRVVVNIARTSEQLQGPRQQADRGWKRGADEDARWRGYPLSQLLYRLRALSETENPSPLGAYLVTHNLWEIATFCVSTPIAA